MLAEKNRVNLNAWISNTSTHNNIGDYLSLPIVSHLCNKHGLELAMPVKYTKHKDWYYSTGRMSFLIANSVEEALNMGGTPLEYHVIEQMQEALLNTFPADLWDA